jgi:hypothetical protein
MKEGERKRKGREKYVLKHEIINSLLLRYDDSYEAAYITGKASDEYTEGIRGEFVQKNRIGRRCFTSMKYKT